jgi:hypothetical protein
MLSGAVIASKKIAAIEVGLGFEIASLQRRCPQVFAEEGERGEKFDERRMLGVKAEVAGLLHHVAGKDVIIFVEGQGLTMDNEGHLRGLNDKKGEDSDPRTSL